MMDMEFRSNFGSSNSCHQSSSSNLILKYRMIGLCLYNLHMKCLICRNLQRYPSIDPKDMRDTGYKYSYLKDMEYR